MALLIGAMGCSVDVLNVEQDDSLKIVFEATPFLDGDSNLDTRTSVIPNESYSSYQFIWSAKDTVGIYPDAGSQVYFTMENGAGASSATFDGGAWTCKEGHVYRSYFPFIGNIYLDKTKIPVSFIGQKQVGNDNSDHFQKYDYMYAPVAPKENGSLNFSYHHLITGVLPWVELPAGHYTGLTLSLDEALFVTEGKYDLTAESPTIIGTKYSDSMSIELDVTFDSPDILKVYVPLAPMDMSGKTLTVTITDEDGEEFQYTYKPSKPYDASNIYRLKSTTSFVQRVYSIENDYLAAYLDYVEAHPYDPSDYSYTYMTTEYYGGTSQTNRLDWPKPVPVSWTNPTSGNSSKVVNVFNDKNKAETDLELSVPVSDNNLTTVDIYNLIPGRTYYYTVMNGDSELSGGIFKTTGRRRMMRVGDDSYDKSHANNCRDFGGQITLDGRKIKYGKIYRGSNMDNTTSVQKDYLLNYMKVGLDVDLRGSNELNDALGLGSMHTEQTYSNWGDLSDKDKMSATLTQIFNAVANNTVVYIHCMVGADRTGYTCMLLEALLGIPQNYCDIDYELTSFSKAVGTRTRDLSNQSYYYYRTVTYKQFWSNTITTVQGVHFINTFEGNTFQEKAINYVTTPKSEGGLGIPLELITTFQNKMLEDIM